MYGVFRRQAGEDEWKAYTTGRDQDRFEMLVKETGDLIGKLFLGYGLDSLTMTKQDGTVVEYRLAEL